MSSRWRRVESGEGFIPVEMRFIDLFMTAIGALIFLALLFLLFVNTHKSLGGPIPTKPPLVLSDIPLPGARVDERYQVALAYRGGVPPIRWVNVGQESHGLQYYDNGSVAGIPSEAGDYKFQASVEDGAGQKATYRYVVHVAGAASPLFPVDKLVQMTFLATISIMIIGIIVIVVWGTRSKEITPAMIRAGAHALALATGTEAEVNDVVSSSDAGVVRAIYQAMFQARSF
jgi:hypothetical protein